MIQLLALLNAIAPMSQALQDYLMEILQCRKFLKGEYILKEGKIASHIYFLEKGLVRIYHQRKDVEVTSWLLIENEIFISVYSFLQQMPSYENIVALEDCLCWGISYEQLDEICSRFPEFKDHQIYLLRKYYSRTDERRFKMERQKPLERYTQLVEEEPELLQRVPHHILNSYLEMSDRTFRRARSDYKRRKK